MTERLADLNTRLEGVRELGMVVNAMRGIAAARAQQARNQVSAVDSFSQTIATAIGQALALLPPGQASQVQSSTRPVLLLFCAEQGFAGAFSERIFEAVRADLGHSDIFLIGTRGSVVASDLGIAIDWAHPMSSHSSAIPKLADRIADALYARIATGQIDRLDAVFSRWQARGGTSVERRRLFPVDLEIFPSSPAEDGAPLANLPAKELLWQLTEDYLYAQLCSAGLHAFAAENEARMEAMAAARSQVEHQLADLQARQRQARQEEITAEIIELAAGETVSRALSEQSG